MLYDYGLQIEKCLGLIAAQKMGVVMRGYLQ
jgi:hypothetical protein